MTLQQQEQALEVLEQEADVIAAFLASLDTCRLHMIGLVVHDELVLRTQGKPYDKSQLH